MCQCLVKISQSCVRPGPETTSHICVAINWNDLWASVVLQYERSITEQKKKKKPVHLCPLTRSPFVFVLFCSLCPFPLPYTVGGFAFSVESSLGSVFGGADILESVMWRWNLFRLEQSVSLLISLGVVCCLAMKSRLPMKSRYATHQVTARSDRVSVWSSQSGPANLLALGLFFFPLFQHFLYMYLLTCHCFGTHSLLPSPGRLFLHPFYLFSITLPNFFSNSLHSMTAPRQLLHIHSLSLSSLLLFVCLLFSDVALRLSHFNLPPQSSPPLQLLSSPTERPEVSVYIQGYAAWRDVCVHGRTCGRPTVLVTGVWCDVVAAASVCLFTSHSHLEFISDAFASGESLKHTHTNSNARPSSVFPTVCCCCFFSFCASPP